jgi:hypothetical protein
MKVYREGDCLDSNVKKIEDLKDKRLIVENGTS